MKEASRLYNHCKEGEWGIATSFLTKCNKSSIERTSWKSGHTPLHAACLKGADADFIELLLDKNRRPSDSGPPRAVTIQAKNEMLPLHIACEEGARHRVLEVLVAAYEESLRMVDQLLRSPLHCRLASKRKPPTVEDVLLLTSGRGSVVAKSTDENRNYPLHVACEHGSSPEIVELLLLDFPDALGLSNQHGDTPLDLASRNRDNEEVQNLLREGVEYWRREVKGRVRVFGRWRLIHELQPGGKITLSSIESVTRGLKILNQTQRAREWSMNTLASIAPWLCKFQVAAGVKFTRSQMNQIVNDIVFKEEHIATLEYSQQKDRKCSKYIWQYEICTEVENGPLVVLGTKEFAESEDRAHDPDSGRFEWLQHKETQKVIDAYYVISFPPVGQQNIHAPSRRLAKLKGIKEDLEGYGADNALRNLRSKNHLIQISNGRGDDVRKELSSSDIRLFIWCAEGLDECSESHKELSTRDFNDSKTDLLLVCMKFGARHVAKTLSDVTSRPVISMRCDPFRELQTLCAVVFLPFVASVLIDGDIDKSFRLLNDKAKLFNTSCECDIHYPVNGTNAGVPAQYHHRSLMKREQICPLLTIGSHSTTEWFSTKGLRELKMNAGDVDVLSRVLKYFKDHGRLNRHHLCLFLRPDSSLSEAEVQEFQACERARAVALYACDRVAGDEIFHHGVFRVATREDRVETEEQLKGRTNNALLWLDFAHPDGHAPFTSAEELEEWLCGLDTTLLLVITSARKHNKHLGKFVKSARHSKLLRVELFQMTKYVQIGLTLDHLRGVIRILPLEHADEESNCVLDVIDPKSMKHRLDRVFTDNSWSEGVKTDPKVQDIAMYRDDDNSVQIAVRVSNPKFLTWLRDKILIGRHPHELVVLPFPSVVRFDSTAMADIYENLILLLDNVTEYQRRKLVECGDWRAVHIRGPAGCGKTFLALNRVLAYLHGDPDATVLYVCGNAALAFHFIRWLCHRLHREERSIPLTLSQIFFLTAEKPSSVCSVYCSEETTLQERVQPPSRRFARRFGLIVVDQAHDIFCRNLEGSHGKLKETTISILRSNKRSELMVLSDASQASVPQTDIDRELDRKWYSVRRLLLPRHRQLCQLKLDEVCRSSQRIIVGSMCFQVGEERPATCCAHDSGGLPLCTVLFDVPGHDEDLYAEYSNRVVWCIVDLLRIFPGLDLDNRVAVVVPDEAFRTALCSEEKNNPLGKALDRAADTLGQSLVPVTARTASRCLGLERGARSSERKRIVVDSVHQVDGLERLVVIGVGLDKVVDVESRIICTRIYRAVTRAQLMFYLVNERVRGGWFEFLDNLVLSSGGSDTTSQIEKLSPRTARKVVSGLGEEENVHKSSIPHRALWMFSGKRENAIFDTRGNTPVDTTIPKREPNFVPVSDEPRLWRDWAQKYSDLSPHGDQTNRRIGPRSYP